MYLPSDTPLLTGQQHAAACRAAKAQRCVNAAKYQMADGRAQLFETVIPPQTVAETMGIPVAVNTQRLQDQSLQSRAAILAGQSGEAQDTPVSSIGDYIGQAPKVTPLNGSQIPCTQLEYQPRQLPENARPGMPQRAPGIVNSTLGPLYYTGAAPSYGAPGGLTGYSPPWSDAFVVSGPGQTAGVVSWVKDHPWLALGLAAGVGLVAASGRKRGRK